MSFSASWKLTPGFCRVRSEAGYRTSLGRSLNEKPLERFSNHGFFVRELAVLDLGSQKVLEIVCKRYVHRGQSCQLLSLLMVPAWSSLIDYLKTLSHGKITALSCCSDHRSGSEKRSRGLSPERADVPSLDSAGLGLEITPELIVISPYRPV